MWIAYRVGVALFLALTPIVAMADDRPFKDIVWCSDGFDQKATIRTTSEGLELRIGDAVEMLEVDGGTTPYGGLIATSLKTKEDSIVLPGELVFGHDMEN